MSNFDRADLPVRYCITSAAVGQIDCQRIGNGALLGLGAAAASGRATPEQTARGFLQRVGRKPEGSHPRGDLLTDDDVAAVSIAELEEFAEKTIVENEYLTRERVGREEGTGEGGKPQVLFGDTVLERGEGEGAIGFLARAVADFPERFAPDAKHAMASSAGQTAIASMRNIYSTAARLAGQTGAASNARPLRMPPASNALGDAPSAKTSSIIETISKMPEPPRPADVTLRKLEERVAAFGADLRSDEQVAIISVSSPGGASFFIQERQAIGREMISLKGFDTDGGIIEVVQHYTQFNVALMGVSKVPMGDVIGFTSGRRGPGTSGIDPT